MLRTIKVTKEHIENGTRGSNRFCPIAQALLGIGCKNVSVGPEHIGYEIYEKFYSRKAPEICKDFIWVFDDGSLVPGPIEFEIEFPEQVTVKIKQEPEQKVTVTVNSNSKQEPENNEQLRNLLGQSC